MLAACVLILVPLGYVLASLGICGLGGRVLYLCFSNSQKVICQGDFLQALTLNQCYERSCGKACGSLFMQCQKYQNKTGEIDCQTFCGNCTSCYVGSVSNACNCLTCEANVTQTFNSHSPMLVVGGSLVIGSTCFLFLCFVCCCGCICYGCTYGAVTKELRDIPSVNRSDSDAVSPVLDSGGVLG